MAFSKVIIDQFRGIRHCDIDSLGKRVNLFVGKNNCGKTSVLDAIFMLSGISNPYLFYSINSFRECGFTDFEGVSSINFYNLDFNKPINIQGLDLTSKEKRNLVIRPLWGEIFEIADSNGVLSTQSKQKLNRIIYEFEIESKSSRKEYINILEEHNDSDDPETHARAGNITTKDGNTAIYDEKYKGSYLGSKSIFSFPIKDLSSIIKDKKKNIILSSLQEIEPRIKDIAIIQFRVYVDVGIDKMVPIEVLGDGIRRLLSIIVYLYKCQGGNLFIDEIDNGLHHSSMSTLWQTILSTAEQFNVQLYATTHNIDSLKALKNVLEEDQNIHFQKETMCYRLRKAEDDNLIAYKYDFEKFEYAITAEHEIR
ncbi:MAG: AAA family ATPase [Prevotella sp.]|jgi:AAA15 family ATPase/GTPase|nr:AAA family ATPase [Prevotella sp.]